LLDLAADIMLAAREYRFFRRKEPKHEAPGDKNRAQAVTQIRQEPAAPENFHAAGSLDQPPGGNSGCFSYDHFVEKSRSIRNGQEHSSCDVAAGRLANSLHELHCYHDL